jgi:hypothetical protein
MAKRSQYLPPAIDVALNHIVWLRMAYPDIAPETAAAILGQEAWTWAQVVQIYAAQWEGLPPNIRDGGGDAC